MQRVKPRAGGSGGTSRGGNSGRGKFHTPPSLMTQVATKKTGTTSPTDNDQQLQEETLRKEFADAQKKTAHMTSNENTTSHLKRYIRKEVYPKKKFITGERDLMFETKMAKTIVAALCTIDNKFPDLQREWWENRKKIIRHTIDSCRSSNNHAVKKSFHGKLIWNFYCNFP